MPTPLSVALIQPRDAALLAATFESLGLITSSQATVAPIENAPAKPRFIVPAGVKPKASPATLPSESPTQRIEKLIDGLQIPAELIDALFEDISRAPDPAHTLLNLAHLADAVSNRSDLWAHLAANPATRARLMKLLSWSQAISDTLIGEPHLLSQLDAAAAPFSRAQLRRAAREITASVDDRAAKMDALRRFRRRQTLRIGLLDLESDTWRDERDFNIVVRQISDLAQVCVEQTLQIITAEASQSTADASQNQFAESQGVSFRPERGTSAAEKSLGDAKDVLASLDMTPPETLQTDSQSTADALQSTAGEFCVLAMGKMGARELNYSSDIDLIFLHDGDAAEMNRLGAELLKELGGQSAAGHLYRVDMRLRPEGQSGALVTPIGYAFSYYESYAEPWEWQALIKTRVVAGSARLGRRFRRFTRPIVWAKRADDSHLRAVVEMKRRSEATGEGSDARNVKQGPGAIRDAEWVVQQLQMMTGPQHPSARAKATLRALEVLRDFDAISFDEARELRDGYLFLRVLEHRLQLWQERAIRTLPDNTNDKAVLARRVGCAWRGEAAARWIEEEHARHRQNVRAACEKLFWGWRDTAEQADDDDWTTLNLSDESRARLQRLAHGSPTNPLPSPLSRQIRVALPDALRHLDFAADPERALVNLERLSEASGNRLSLLRSLGGAPDLARAVFALLGGSQNLSDTLIRFPELLDLAAQRTLLARAKTWDEARSDCRSYCLTFRDRGAALRRWKKREMLRIGLRDLALDVSPTEITREIADLCRACLDLATGEIEALLRPNSARIGFAIIGMGKLGGGEMHYGSDADVVFAHMAHDDWNGAAELAARWANELTRFMGERTEDGTVFEVDARLRPEGQSGALAPSLGGFFGYFEREHGGVAAWERQALTRARLVAGDAQTGAHLSAAIRHVAFPALWNPDWSAELRHIKERVENERAKNASRGVAAYDVKLGRGGLSDIEWSAQWLALKFGHRHADLRVPNTLAQIQGARESDVLSDDDAQVLRDGYEFLRRAELRLKITQETAPAALEAGSAAWHRWARAMFPDQASQRAAEQFESQWQRHTNAVRVVMERVRDAL